MNMVITKTAEDLKPVLMDQAGQKIKIPYYLIEDKGQVIFAIASGHNGVEFNKTVGYSSSFPGMQTYHSLYGSGILLMQRNDEFGEAKEFKMIMLSAGKHASVPVGWAMCLVNTGSSLLVVLRSVLDEKYQNSKPIIDKKGLAYYIIEKKGEIVFEQNSNYKIHPQISTE